MKKSMRIISILVAICIATIGIANTAGASEIDSKINTGGRVIITSENVDQITMSDSIPIEVKERVSQLIESATEDTEITLIIPVKGTSGAMPSSTIDVGWSYPRQYGGYVVKDYVIMIRNAFDMVDILTSTASAPQLAANFAEDITVYAGSAYIDSIIPFGSAAIMLLDFVFGSESDTVTASAGDKASAAPMYTTYDTFTYVETSDGDVLGARTYASALESITWYFYSESKHKQESKIKSYTSEGMKYSTNYNNRDQVAVQWHTSSGYIDQCISIKIGTKTFNLQ